MCAISCFQTLFIDIKIFELFVQVIVNLVNQRGREKRVGGELDRVVIRAHLNFVRYFELLVSVCVV